MAVDKEIIDLAEMALSEMAPLEAGYFMRDSGFNFPVTMKAIGKAKEKMGILVRSITNQMAIREIGTCPQPAGAGFTEEQIREAKKLEIVNYRHGRDPYTLYSLRGSFNRIIAQVKVQRQNT